jgi:large repetitive protein
MAAGSAVASQASSLIAVVGLLGVAAVVSQGKIKDTTAPKVDTVSDDTAALVSNQDVVFLVTFSEALLGSVGISNFQASNGTVTDVSRVGQSNAYSVTVAPAPNTASAEISLRLVGAGLSDTSGNLVLNADLAVLGRQRTDTLSPTLLMSSDKAALGAQETALITFTFSEDPGSSFAWNGTQGDVVVTGGTLGPLSGSGLTRTAIFTPTADLTGISATLAVGAGSYSDAVGNPGNAATALNIALETRTATSLVIQDGYLDGAEVWVDMNNTGKIDAGDYPLGRSEEGRVNGFLTAAQKGHTLIAQGGVDISTGLPFEGSYSATAGSTVVNPLTTLVQSIVKTELGDTSQLSPQEAIERMAQAKAFAMARVSEALDLPQGVDLTQIDTIATASAGQNNAEAGISLSQALDINSKALMVANLMAVGAAALKGSDNSTGAEAPTLANLSDFIVGSIVKAMDTALASGSALTMDDSGTLTGILASAAQTATETDSGLYSMDPTKLSNASSAVGTAVASTNSLIDTLTGNAKSEVRTDPQAAEDTLLRILAAQKAAMNQIADIKTGDSSKLLAMADNFSDAAAVQVQSQSVGLLRLGTTEAVNAPTQAAEDSAAPQVVSVSVKPERVGELAQFVVLMSEGVLIKTAGPGLPGLAIQTTADGAPSEALLDLSRSGSDKLVFTYRIEPGDTQLAVLSGSIGLVPGSSIQDLSGKPALLSLAGGLVGFSAPQIDSLAPTVTVSARETFVQTGQSTLLTFSVSEAVAFAERSNAVHADAFGADDITVREAGQVVRGRISEFKALGPSQGRYFFEALLTPGNSDAPTEVAVGAGRFTDAAGNPNLASNLVAVAQESVTPSIVVTAEQAAFNAQDTSISTSLFFTLSQDSSNFTADDVTVIGPGSLNNFTGSGRQYSAELSGMDSSTQVQVLAFSFSGTGATAGNLASNTKGFSVDTRAPSVLSISDNTEAVVTRQDISFKVDFDEAVTGTVSTNSFSANLGSVLSVSRLQSSNSYNVVVRPTANVEGTVALSLRASGLGDAAGNPMADANLASKGGQAIDTLAPTLAITSSAPALKAGESATLTFTFSEDPGTSFAWNGTEGDVVVTGGTLGALSGTGLVRTAVFTPSPNLASGSASITVASGNYLDAAGNTGAAGSTPAISIDTLAPTLAITSSAPALKAGESATLTFTFSEDPGNSFAWDGTAGDAVVTGGTLGALSGTGLVRTAVFTPSPNLASGSASITVASAPSTCRCGRQHGRCGQHACHPH